MNNENMPTIGARVTNEFHGVVVSAVKPLGFKNKSALVEAAVRDFLNRNGFEIKPVLETPERQQA